MFKRILILLLVCSIITSMGSCKKYYPDDSTDDETTNETPGSESSDDYIWNNSDVIDIVLKGTSISADNSGVTVSGTKLTIGSAGTYRVSGSLTDGQIIINTMDETIVRLILNGVNINCSNSSPIYVKNSAKTLVVISDNTQNYLTDGKSYSTDSDGEPNAALFCKSYLAFSGTGYLTVKADYEDGITSKDGLLINSGVFDITSADDGIRGKDYVIMRKGNITIKAQSNGIKSDNDTDASLGYITIDSAIMNIKAVAGDAITAQSDLKINDGSFTLSTGTAATAKAGEEGPNPGGGSTGGGYSGTISEKGLKAEVNLTVGKGTYVINTADDAIHSNGSVIINGGEMAISAGDDAIHAETAITINDGTLNISKSYEGLESTAITINDGTVNLVSTDDAFNATKGLQAGGTEQNDGSTLVINGGYVSINTTSGDGLDSNGNLSISGGTVIVHGPQSSPEVAFDINGTFSVSGGFLIGSGPNAGNMIEAPATSSAQYSLKITASSLLTATTLFHLQDASGNDVVTFKPVRSVYYIVFSSPALVNGATFSIYTGGSSTGTARNGVYSGGTYSGGTLKKSVTISGKLTTVAI